MQDKNFAERVLGGFSWIGAMSIVGSLSQFIVLIVLARLLSPTDYGMMTAMTIIISFAEIVWQIGVGPAIVQKKEVSKEDIITAQSVTLILGAIVFILVFMNSTSIIELIGVESKFMLQVLAVVFIINSISAIPESLLHRNLEFKKIAIIESVSYLFGFGVVSIILASIHYGVWALVMGQVSQVLIRMILLIKTSNHTIQKIKIYKKSISALFNFGAGYTLARLFNNIALQADYLVVSRVFGAEKLGEYNKSYQLMNFPAGLIGQVLDRVMFPVMSKMQGKQVEQKAAYVFSTSTIGLVMFPLSAVLFVLSNEIILMLLGPSWESASTSFGILVLFLYFRTAYKISDSLAQSNGAVYRRAWRQLLYAVSVFIFTYSGSFYGIEGVAVGAGLAIVINYGSMLVLSKKLIQFSYKSILVSHLPCFILSVLLLFILQYINNEYLLIYPELIRIIIIILIAIIIYVPVYIFVCLRFADKSTIDFYIAIIKILCKKSDYPIIYLTKLQKKFL